MAFRVIRAARCIGPTLKSRKAVWSTKLFGKLKLWALLALLVFLPGSATLAQSLTDGVTFRTWAEFKERQRFDPSDQGGCTMLAYPLAGKVFGGIGGEAPLTDAQSVSLVGESHRYFGVLGGTRFFVRSTGLVEGMLRAYVITEGFDLSDPDLLKDREKFMAMQAKAQAFSPDMIRDDTPILCGDGSEEKAAGAGRKTKPLGTKPNTLSSYFK